QLLIKRNRFFLFASCKIGETQFSFLFQSPVNSFCEITKSNKALPFLFHIHTILLLMRGTMKTGKRYLSIHGTKDVVGALTVYNPHFHTIFHAYFCGINL